MNRGVLLIIFICIFIDYWAIGGLYSHFEVNTSKAVYAVQAVNPPSTGITYDQYCELYDCYVAPQDIIKRVAEEENYGNVDLLLRIAKAESEFDCSVRGRVDKRDRGCFQINSYHNPEVSDECAFDVACSAKWTINEIKAGRVWKWNASRFKWGL